MKSSRWMDPACCIAALTLLFGLANTAPAQEKSASGKPDIKIKVEKETDETGNITRYDSIYQWSWSGGGGINIDSLLSEFHRQWGEDEFFSPGHLPFQPYFFDDSIGTIPFPRGFDFHRSFPDTDSLFMPYDSSFFFHPFPFPSHDDLMKQMEEMERMIEEVQKRFRDHSQGKLPGEAGKEILPPRKPSHPPAQKKEIKGLEI